MDNHLTASPDLGKVGKTPAVIEVIVGEKYVQPLVAVYELRDLRLEEPTDARARIKQDRRIIREYKIALCLASQGRKEPVGSQWYKLHRAQSYVNQASRWLGDPPHRTRVTSKQSGC